MQGFMRTGPRKLFKTITLSKNMAKQEVQVFFQVGKSVMVVVGFTCAYSAAKLFLCWDREACLLS